MGFTYEQHLKKLKKQQEKFDFDARDILKRLQFGINVAVNVSRGNFSDKHIDDAGHF